AGALFNHKSNKTGRHDSCHVFMEEKLGQLATFPDTSNNRFQTHAFAVEQLIINLDTYIEFLSYAKDQKAKHTFTNIKQKLFNVLHDIPTLEELAMLTVYSQILSLDPNLNALDMGPLHQSVFDLCKSIVKN
ncbi:hypothetical protein BT96DRAFT_773377, partial [Gymnopus androsaceus JB14]